MKSALFPGVTFRGSLLLFGGLLAGGPPLSAASAPERSDLDSSYTWDLSVMYPSPEDWEAHYRQVETQIRRIAELRGSLQRGPEQLARVLALRDDLDIQLEKLYAYARLRHDEDMRQPGPLATLQRAQNLSTQYGEAVAWLSPELLGLPQTQLQDWLQRKDLKVYTHYVDNLFRSRQHVLPTREEELLAMSAEAVNASSDAFSLLTNTELHRRSVPDPEGQEILVTDPVFYRAMQSKDRRFRRDAFVALHGSYLDVKGTLAATLAGAMQRDWYRAKARGYASSLEASLDAENLPVSVYRNLIATVRQHAPLLQRYVALKRQRLGIDAVHFYDLYVDLTPAPEREYPFAEARELVLTGVASFGPEYGATMRLAFDSRWIDVFENAGKRSGAYNMGTYLAPPYVLMNYKGTFDSVSTLAHEMGHAMQSYFTKETQPPVYSGYPMFTAEVASTAAEILFKQFLLDQTTNRTERAQLIGRMLEDIRQTVFRQTQFAEFDLAAHELADQGQPMTAEVLMKMNHDSYLAYYGPDFVIDPELDVECLRIPHYYRDFYVYRYATSYCAAAAVVKRILAGEPGAVERWMQFLKTGNSQYALDMLKTAGVDLTTPQPIEDCMELFEKLLDQLETLLTEPA